MEKQSHRSEMEPSSGKESAKNKTTSRPKLPVRFADGTITASLLMLFFGVPLFFTGLSFQGIAFEKQIYFYFWILIALVAWAAKGVTSGEMKLRRTPLDIPIALFWVVYLLATIFSVDRWHSFMGFPGDPSRGLLSITALVIAYYFVCSNVSQRRIGLILAAILTSGAVVSLWTVLSIMGVKFLPAKMLAIAPLSLLGSSPGLGVFLSALVPLAITAIFKVRTSAALKSRKKNILTGALLVLLALDFFLMFALYVFVPWIAMLIGSGFFVIFILSRIIRPVENWAWLPMAAFVLVMIIMLGGGSFTIARVNMPVEVSQTYQLSWQIAKATLKDKLFLGSGAATYGYDFSLYKPQEFNVNTLYNLRFYQGNGLFFEALSTIGLLGTIAAVLLGLTFLSVVVYLLASHKEKDKVYALGFVTSALVLVIAGEMTKTESAMLIMSVLIAALALALAMSESEAEEKYVHFSLKASPKFALALAFVFMLVTAGVAFLFVFIGKTYAADLYAGAALRQGQTNKDGAVGNLIKAINLNNKEGQYYSLIGQEYMMQANDEMAKDASQVDINTVQNDLSNAIVAASQGRDLMKNDVLANQTLGQIYENAGAYVPDSITSAETAYQQALNLEPHNPDLILKLGQMKLGEAANSKDDGQRNNLVGQAKDLFQRSINEKTNYAAGYYQLALAQDALGDVSGAIGSMTEAINLDNSNVNFFFNLARLYQERGQGDDNKTAEALFKQILSVNGNDINTNFSLGLLYEKTNRKDEAIAQYQKVLNLLPAGSASDQAKSQVQKMISNIQNGIENTPENLGAAPAAQAGAPAAGSAPANQ